jgi:secreted Zn-dependent insulinase-like peptidase
LPYKEPSNVLYQLLADIVNEGRRFASAADVKASDINGEAPVGTTLAVLEREMKVMSAVQARVHASVGKELKILSNIVRDHGPETYPYELSEDPLVSEDFDDRIDIIPVSDPNAGTMAQRIMQYQAALQLAAQAPQMYDMPLLHRQMLEVLGIQDADQIVPTENDMKPTDPVSENMNIITGEPVKAFIYQDHEAHIQTHMSAVENPQIVELMKKAPNAKAIEAAMAAHIQEHVAFAYRQRIEKELGVELPAPDEPLPEDIELRLSRLVAPAAQQVTGKAQQMAQAEQNAKQMQDPVIQMQQKELQIEEGKVMAKAQADMARIQLDLQKAQEKASLDRDKLESQERIASAKIGAQVASDAVKKDEIESKEAIEGVKIGIDLVQDMIDND